MPETEEDPEPFRSNGAAEALQDAKVVQSHPPVQAHVGSSAVLLEVSTLRSTVQKLELELASVRSELSQYKELFEVLQSEGDEIKEASSIDLNKAAGAGNDSGKDVEATAAETAVEEVAAKRPGSKEANGSYKSKSTSTYASSDEDLEIWRSEESIWDVVLYFGDFMSIPVRIFLTALFIANTAMQMLLAQVISEMAAEADPLLEDLQGLLLWRLSVGHHVSHYDELTGSNLVTRVCQQYVALTESYSHSWGHEAFGKYLQREVDASDIPDIGILEHLDVPVGQFLCCIVLLVWIFTIVMEIQDAYTMAIAYTSIPRGARTRWHRASDGCVSMITLSWHKYVGLMIFVVVPRCLVAIVLLTVGSKFVIQTSSLTDLILNALALSFVFELDELFYKLVPPNIQRLITQSEPIPLTLPFQSLLSKVTGRSQIRQGWSEMAVALLIVGVWIFYCATSATDVADDIDEAHAILCGGNTSFLYTTNRATGAVYYNHGRSDDDIESGSLMTLMGADNRIVLDLTISAVLQLTNLRSLDLPTVNDLPPEVTGDRDMPMALPTDLPIVGEMYRETISGAMDRLACADVDKKVPDRYALYTTVVLDSLGQVEVPQAPNNTDCQVVSGLCLDEKVKRRCPVTCRCLDLYYGYFDLDGCPPSCEDVVEDELRVIVQGYQFVVSSSCMDAPKVVTEADSQQYPNAKWWREYFWQVQVYLAKQGFLTEVPGTTAWPWTTALQDALSRRTVGRYYLADGDLVDLVAIADYASSETLSPCVVEVYFRRVFDLQLCSTVFNGDLRGTLAALCPVQCGLCTVMPGPNGTLPRGVDAGAWSWMDILDYQESVFGVSLVQRTPPSFQTLHCGEDLLADSSHNGVSWGFLPGPDLIYSFNATDPSVYYTVHLCSPRTVIDTVVRIFRGPWTTSMVDDPSLLIREADDSCGSDGRASSVTVTGLQPGEYTVWIDGPSASGGIVETIFRCTSTPLFWDVIDGTCTVTTDSSSRSCVQSPNFPGLYPADDCEIRIFPDAWQLEQQVLTATDFDTLDPSELHVTTSGPVVTINDKALLDSIGSVPTNNILWRPISLSASSGSTRRQRWEICAQHVDLEPWRLDPGPCRRAFYQQQDCISNNDFDARRYNIFESCFVQVNFNWSSLPGPSSGIQVESFRTESGWDLLYLDKGMSTEREYSNRGSGLEGQIPATNIFWTSDESYTESGWIICVKP